MRLFKKLTTLTVAAVLCASCLFSGMTVIAVNEGYRRGSVTEDFETLTIAEINAGKSSVIEKIADASSASIVSLPLADSGKSISLSSANKANYVDTKKEIFNKFDVTVLDYYIAVPDKSKTSTSSLIEFRYNNGTKEVNQYLVGFNGGALKTWLASSATAITPNEKLSNNYYYPVRVIFDKPNKTITARVYDANTNTVKEFSKSISNGWSNAYVRFNSDSNGLNNTLIDDITVSDGFYLENDYINENFTHVKSTQNETVNGFMRSSAFCTGKFDTADGNTYWQITPNTSVATEYGQCIVGANTSGITFAEGKPTVIKFRARMTGTSTFKATLRLQNGTRINFVLNSNGTVSSPIIGGTTKNANDGNWHTYRIKITPRTGNKGCDATVFADNTYLGYKANTNWDFTNGARMEWYLKDTASAFDLDDVQICNPSAPKARLIEGATENVAIDDASFTFEGNNPIHTSNFSKDGAIVLKETNGETTVPISINFDTNNKNNFIIKPLHVLKPETSYTLSYASNIAKDMYDQYFSGDLLTFTTAAAAGDTVAMIKGTLGNGEIAENFSPSGNLTVTVSAYSKAAESKKIVGYAAIYDSELTTLLGVQRVEITPSAGEVVSASDTLSLSGAAKLALYIWQDDTLTPLKTSSVFTATR